MPTFINTETGETFEGDHECPNCSQTQAECEAIMRGMEREARSRLARITKLENDVERDKVKHRDKALWDRILERWTETFPKTRITAKKHTSARATDVFLRIEAGATEQDFMDAIAGAREYPYLDWERTRVKKPDPKGGRVAIDLQDIAHLKRDALFEFLVNKGRELRGAG